MCNVLVIDDEESIVLMITMALARYGCNVEIATDSTAGIKKFDEGHFNLVITDIRMPGIDGNGVARHIRNSKKPSTPIVGMSGTPWLHDDDYFDVILSKPFSIKVLIDTVKYLSKAPLKKLAVE
jgi:CheY-like chemotaxis protein